MAISVSIMTDGVRIYADLSNIGLMPVEIVPKPNFNYVEENRPQLEGHRDTIYVIHHPQPGGGYNTILSVATGPYAGFRRTVHSVKEPFVISVPDLVRCYYVAFKDDGQRMMAEIDLKKIYQIKEHLYPYIEEF